jgi:hypothetical protein
MFFEDVQGLDEDLDVTIFNIYCYFSLVTMLLIKGLIWKIYFMYNMSKLIRYEGFRNMRTSYDNLESLNSIASKGESYDEVLSKIIAAAKPLLKEVRRK